MNDFVLPLARLCAGLGLLMAGVAQAQLANNLTIGNPKAMALANAVTADSTGVDAVHYNPAALTKLKGRQTTVKFLTGVMDIRAEFDAPPGYGAFGYSDDYVKNSSSRTLTPAMYLPGLGGDDRSSDVVCAAGGTVDQSAGFQADFCHQCLCADGARLFEGR